MSSLRCRRFVVNVPLDPSLLPAWYRANSLPGQLRTARSRSLTHATTPRQSARSLAEPSRAAFLRERRRAHSSRQLSPNSGCARAWSPSLLLEGVSGEGRDGLRPRRRRQQQQQEQQEFESSWRLGAGLSVRGRRGAVRAQPKRAARSRIAHELGSSSDNSLSVCVSLISN
ncbi:unnamed protein product [Lampetra planeri]